MINLLPPELKQAYKYAHRNVGLLRWVIAFGLGFLGLIAIATAGLVYMQQAAQTYNKQITAAQVSLSEQKLAATQVQVQDISNSLKLAVQVLSKEVLFSKLLGQLAVVMPSNAVLTDLAISQTQGAVDITAMATDYGAATQVQVNLADPANKIFSSADIQSITCVSPTAGSDPTIAHYPCTVTIRALFAANNPFLFINNSGQ